MGRTVLPFSMVLAEQQKRLGQFRRTLRKQDQELLMNCLNARACMQAATRRLARTDGIDLISVLIECSERRNICKRVDELKRAAGCKEVSRKTLFQSAIRNLQSAI